MVKSTNGNTFFEPSRHRPVSPHIMPNEEKRKADIPMVGEETYMGRKLAAVASNKEGSGRILLRIFHNTIILTIKWNALA